MDRQTEKHPIEQKNGNNSTKIKYTTRERKWVIENYKHRESTNCHRQINIQIHAYIRVYIYTSKVVVAGIPLNLLGISCSFSDYSIIINPLSHFIPPLVKQKVSMDKSRQMWRFQIDIDVIDPSRTHRSLLNFRHKQLRVQRITTEYASKRRNNMQK